MNIQTLTDKIIASVPPAIPECDIDKYGGNHATGSNGYRNAVIASIPEIIRIVADAQRESDAKIAEHIFVECSLCSSKPGSPYLCKSCLSNRDGIASAIRSNHIEV
ncbi:hypothetical protein [Rhodopseudomonas palustris]|uniref:hypothetical protein n=1 Tax=Rhodopseudomonas palustris TaxID=1076 RepID=UPI00131EA72D|nr:hypothetical protein [Rhodopseudomonas palustris]